ncbi:hypothetical protein BJ508DRAFT_327565 [Ascobolus immersus RN42]|uniref:Uncharacterized protein n=1 Tax=Ascobolus immersus RN42 TaxID=1160509 RepID=A0A3N4I476_ASCIM|nr:hypothetical protein BJ508DRAFT_327565 [Ascobolus immersus RN42]
MADQAPSTPTRPQIIPTKRPHSSSISTIHGDNMVMEAVPSLQPPQASFDGVFRLSMANTRSVQDAINKVSSSSDISRVPESVKRENIAEIRKDVTKILKRASLSPPSSPPAPASNQQHNQFPPKYHHIATDDAGTSDPFERLPTSPVPTTRVEKADAHTSLHACKKRIGCNEIIPHSGRCAAIFDPAIISAEELHAHQEPCNHEEVFISITMDTNGGFQYACVAEYNTPSPTIVGFVCVPDDQSHFLFKDLLATKHEIIGTIHGRRRMSDGKVHFILVWHTDPWFCDRFFEFTPEIADGLKERSKHYERAASLYWKRSESDQ